MHSSSGFSRLSFSEILGLTHQVWSRVLKLGSVPQSCGFLEAGGDSLDAVEIAIALGEATGIHVEASDLLLKNPTAEQVAQWIVASMTASPTDEPAQAESSSAASLASMGQARLYAIESNSQRNAETWRCDRSEYVVAFSIDLHGKLDVRALQRSLDEILIRHEPLRSAFGAASSVVFVKPLPQHSWPLQIIPVHAKGLERRSAAVKQHAIEIERPFDLAKGPLVRGLLLRHAHDDHTLLIAVHHVAIDAASISIFLKELSAGYGLALKPGKFEQSTLPATYADFVRAERVFLESDEARAELDWWIEWLCPVTPVELPAPTRPVVADPKQAYGQVVRTATPTLTRRLGEQSRAHQCTLFTSLLAAFQFVIARYADTNDFAIVSPMSCRSRYDWQELIGFFSNMVPLRAAIDDTLTVRELLRRTQQQIGEAFRRRNTPLDQIISRLNIVGQHAGTSLTKIAFALDEVFPDQHADCGLEFCNTTLRTTTSRFPLEVRVWHDGRQLHVGVHFDRRELEEHFVLQLTASYLRALQFLVDEPDSPLFTCQLVPPVEVEHSAGPPMTLDTASPRLDVRFREVAAQVPGRVALDSFEGELTYGELEKLANQLAARIAEVGLEPEGRVAVCCGRLRGFVIGVLSALKAGGCYVAIDPDWPQGRIEQLIKCCSCRVLLTDSRAPLADTAIEIPVISVNDRTRSRRPFHYEGIASSNVAAYVMFTSGSTGEPKGVVITHASVLALVADPRYAQLSSEDVIAQASNRAFDACTFELWGTLLKGAKLLEIDRHDLLSADQFRATVKNSGITKLFVTTALFNELVRQDPGVFNGLEAVLFGGERVVIDRVVQSLHGGPPRRLVHVYGPTETTTFATWHDVKATESDETVPIGRPIQGTQCFVMDRHLNRVPQGVSGELYLAGAGLARGYSDDPAATAERFVPHPYSKSPGERLFRTGDRVRVRFDGSIEFLERLDEQIKIRGFRVEPGEIESVLRRCEQVQEAVVMSIASPTSGDSKLVAWIETRPHRLLGPGALPAERNTKDLDQELRQLIGASLPYWMVPARLVLIDSLPRNSNGKIDRQALRLKLPSEGLPETLYVAPQSEEEAGVCRIFADLLNSDRVGATDDFFRLGGHSLLATQLVSRIRSLLSVSLPISSVFRSPTPQALADEIKLARVATEQHHEIALKPIPRYDGVFPASFAQQRLWFIDQLEPGSAAYNVPLSTRFMGPFDVRAMRRAVDAIVERHEALRTTFATRDGEVVQIINPVLAATFEIMDLDKLPDHERAARASDLAIQFMARPFDLARDCMLRIQVLRMRETDHVLLICMHHIASDGWSLGVLVRELADLYKAFRSDRESPLRELTIQYADFSVWQRSFLRDERLHALLGWWQKQLEGLHVLTLPSDHPRPDTFSGKGRVVSRRLPRSLEGQLRAFGRRENATLFMTMLAGLQVLLSRYTGQTDIAVGSPIANRVRSSLEGLIGFFVNSLVMRTDLADDPTYRSLVSRTRSTALDAYEHQDLPFERLVEALQPVRDISRNPLFEITFAVQNAPFDMMEIEGVAEFDFEVTSARFDLELDVRERPDGLVLDAFFREELFERQTIERLLEHFEILLTDLVAHSDRRVSVANLLGDNELASLCDVTSQLHVPRYSYTMLHRGFEATVLRTPNAIAACRGARSLSFAELNARADQLASQLRAAGALSDEAIAFDADRSLEMLIVTLAVLKANAACLPLDPQHPFERLLEFMRQARVRFWVGAAGKEGWPDIETIVLQSHTAESTVISAPDHPEQAAYILFTSGSTGKPNGVVLPHRALGNFASSVAERLELKSDDRLLQFAAPGFDVVIEELFPIWFAGGAVILTDAERLASPTTFSVLIEEQRITTVELPAAFWRAWVDHLIANGASPPCCLRSVMVGCEQPDLSRLQWWQQTHVALFTVFGLTETAVTSSMCRLPPLDRQRIVEPLSLGASIENSRYFVLDCHLNLVPVGTIGELYIGGLGLARSYLDNPRLTAERFVPNPFGAEYGTRLYRTGDLARYRKDGAIDFIGRRDLQFNLRGFRIEAEEVEAAIGQHSLVAEAAVKVDGTGQNARLVAYIARRRSSSEYADICQAANHTFLNSWREFYNDTYANSPSNQPWNLAGWVSTFTGEPIPEDDMREQVQQTVARILSLRPSSVLEVGCGSGLLLHRVAPHCRRYVATDSSAAAIETVQQGLSQANYRSRVTLLTQDALDIDRLVGESFDLICLNSVMQHFPDVEYLAEVIERLAPLVARGGQILLGDVRLRPHASLFYWTVERFRATVGEDPQTLAAKVAQRAANEPDLLVDPSLFSILGKRIDRNVKVQIHLKRGHNPNELCRYRVDVILQLDSGQRRVPPAHWPLWQPESMSTAQIEEHLRNAKPDVLYIRHVLNGRLAADEAARQGLQAVHHPTNRNEEAANVVEPLAINPERLWALSEHLPYNVDIRLSPDSPLCYDVSFVRKSPAVSGGELSQVEFPSINDDDLSLADCANRPVQKIVDREIVERVRRYLQGILPQYMIPGMFVCIESLPLTAHGKLDRNALPVPVAVTSAATSAERRPRNETEDKLLHIWSEVLQLAVADVEANFFELGGHSLLAVQVVSRLRSEFAIEVPLRAMFESPTVRTLSEYLNRLCDLVARRPTSTIPRTSRNESLVLSFGQERLWFLNQLDPSSCSYNMVLALRLRGPLNIVALESSIRALVLRHEVLRTVYPASQGRPVQSVLPEWQGCLEVSTLTDKSSADREVAIADHTRRLEGTPFDLTTESVLRCKLLCFDAAEHALLIAIHHIAADGWSLSVLAQELTQNYDAFASSKEPSLSPLAVQFADVAAWQRSRLFANRYQQQMEYWQKELADLEPLTLQAEFLQSATGVREGDAVSRRFDKSLVQSAKSFGERHGATPFMTFLAAFDVLLARVTGQTDIAVGIPVANRIREELEPMIGFFVNSLVMRSNLADAPSFEQLLLRVRDKSLAAFANQDLPFEQIVDQLRPDRSLGWNPLFQVMFAYEPKTEFALQFKNLSIEPIDFATKTARFDLEVHVLDDAGSATVVAIYDRKRFEAGTIVQWLESYERLLSVLLAKPHASVSSATCLSLEQQERVLVDWNRSLGDNLDRMRSIGDARCLHARFSEQARRCCRRIAVRCGESTLSYAQLDDQSNRLSAILRRQGVGPETRVALLLERSTESVVAILGTLKAGGVYLPLDVRLPASRLDMLLDDARPRVLLVDDYTRDLASKLHTTGVTIHVRSAANEADEPTVTALVSPDNLAYILYTSGSSGSPKGVAVTHLNVIRHVENTQTWGPTNEADVWSVFHSFGFDFSVWEMWGCLLTGGEMVIVPDDVRNSPQAFCDLLVSQCVTIVNLTPTAFTSLLRSSSLLAQRDSLAIRILFLGGEVADPSTLKMWFDRFNSAPQLTHVYGITETTVFVTGQRIRRSDLASWEPGAPIGHTLPEWTIYLLDEYFNPVPPGAIGEIHVGGPGLARGYWDDARMTADRFIPNPWGPRGARLYRSGDLGRHRSDGTLEYRGRSDDQVKVRGHRIEPAELVAALRLHSNVQDAIVIGVPYNPGTLNLVAYVVPRNEDKPLSDLRAALFDYLNELMPKWMLPSAIICLDKFPLTSTGKVNRMALPAVRSSDIVSDRPYVAPRNPLEKMLADIWSDVLGCGPVGVYDNFFELGGHSLLAAQASARVRETARVDLPLRLLFEKPNIAGLADWIDAVGGSTKDSLVVIKRMPRDQDLPLSHAQSRLWFIHKLDPQDCAYNVPVALRIRGELVRAAVQKSVDYLVRRHESFRTVFLERDGHPCQRICPTSPFPLLITDLSRLSADARRQNLQRLLRAEETTHFELNGGPVFRAHLIVGPVDESVVILTSHHIISDGWSTNILKAEFSTCYEAYSSGCEPDLPGLFLQYADFAAWQHSDVGSNMQQADLEWWRARLADSLPTRLQDARTLVALASSQAASVTAIVRPELVVRLDRICRQFSVSQYMLLLAALNFALAHHTDTRDIVIGTPITNRVRREFERVIGFFVNLLVMRTRIDDASTFVELLNQVREHVLEAFSHQAISFERLVEELRPHRSPVENPLFNILFSFQNAPFASEHDSHGISLIGQEITTTRFELELLVWDHHDPTEDLTSYGSRPTVDARDARKPHELRFVAVFREDMFDRACIEQLLSDWIEVLTIVADDSTLALSELAGHLSERPSFNQARTVLVSDDTADLLVPMCNRLEQLVKGYATHTPDKIAIRDATTAVTYAELDRRAEALAAQLRSWGVRWEAPVGILIERSANAVIAMLGILKVGGVFVPLPCEAPLQRLKVLIEQAAVRHIVATGELPSTLAGLEVTCVSMDRPPNLLEPDQAQRIPPLPQALAYIMFTSGSTGIPKAVGVTHNSIVRLVVETDYIHFSPGDVVGQIADMAFDGSTFEIWGALLNGATLDIVDRATTLDATALGQHFVQHAIAVAFLPTSLFHQLAADQPEIFQTLRYLIVGGERLNPTIAGQVLRAGARRLVNGYGPTETTTFSTSHPVVRVSEQAASIPIGKPILGVECYVLDHDLQPVRPRECGELYIAGSGLGRGYVNDAALTAERFLPNPFSESPGERLYRTGDEATLLPSGAIEFLGRTDQQIKIRGHRVELSEVEATLGMHPEVQQAVVLLEDRSQEEVKLVCYVTRRDHNDNEQAANEHVINWRRLYDDLYEQQRPDFASDLNLVGWNSSDTGKPIAAEAMREQIKQSIGRIRRIAPRNVLEIGCGTGLLLLNLAGECESYIGTDLSPVAIEYVRHHARTLLQRQTNIQLLSRDALNFDGFRSAQFDTVILNSVVQYLPSVEYLVKVLRGVATVLRPGGRIFLGDIRSLPLLRTLLTEVVLHGAGEATRCADLLQQIEHRCLEEDELLLDPQFFFTDLPLSVSDVRIELKEGRHATELTRYRYDVVLSIADSGVKQSSQPSIENWLVPTVDEDPIAQIKNALLKRPVALGVRGLANARIRQSILAESLVRGAGEQATVGDLRQEMAAATYATPAVDPQDLWDLGNRSGYDVEIRPSFDDAACLDVIFASGEQLGATSHFPTRPMSLPVTLRPMASAPQLPVLSRELSAHLAEHLRMLLPDYMIPTRFIVLERFPLTANGKIDIRALPALPTAPVGATDGYVAPATQTELILARVWRELLRIERVGATDNFFRMGGHSLLATQVVSRIRRAFGIDLPLRVLFERQTLQELAKGIEDTVATGATKTEPQIAIVRRSDELPLSFAQQRLWFLEQLDPERCSYNMPAALHLRGSLDVNALQCSLDAIVQRHEALRTSFPVRNGRPFQRVAVSSACSLSMIDLRDEPAEARERLVARYARLEETTPFDLESGPLLRGKLLCCPDGDWVLLLTMHHIVSDGWSITVLTRELAELYSAQIEGRPDSLPKLPIQYADFACWQREAYAGPALQRHIEYWRARLQGLEPIRLPVDRPAPTKRSFRGAVVEKTLPRPLCQSINQFAQHEKSTLFITLLATFQVLLSRWSGQTDIAVGTPIANRNRHETEGLIGFFVNSLVMRADLSDDPVFRDFLHSVRDTALEAYEHQDLPFEKLVEELRPERNLSQNPLFQVLFAVQNAGSLDFGLPGLQVSVVEYELTTTRFDLEIHVWQEDDELIVHAFFGSELFERSTIERLVAHFERLLVSIIENPARRVSELPLLLDSEQESLLHSWNRLSISDAVLMNLHERFEQIAAQRPEHIAVVDEEREVKYGELDRRANELAERLLSVRLEPESLVPVCCERTIDMIVAIIGVLKAGGAYVPLDPRWPQERISRILAETRARAIVVDRASEIGIPASTRRLVVDCEMPLPSESRMKRSRPVTRPDQLAYVMYTSGSTGQAKGVQITHGNVCRLFQQCERLLSFNEDDVWSLFHAFTFDFSTWEIWGALLYGGRLVIVPEIARRSPLDCLALVRAHRVTILSQTPTAFAQLLAVVDVPSQAGLLSLRHVVFGGEALDPQILRTWFQTFGDQSPQIVNMYGITETTVHVTFQPIRWEHLQQRAGGTPIGRRLDDLQIYVLDENGNPAPRGSIGEIYVGGLGLARGYWGDSALTAERFVPHPWGPAGSRLYRTGDLARYFGDESLEYWGRADHQIKLRGFRIEPAEIENCLRGHGKVLDALVTLYRQPEGDSWLVAFVVKPAHVEVEAEELSAELHRFARLHLPEHMLPRAYMLLDVFPRTSNGKVDRSALPAPRAIRPELSGEFIAPRSETQRALAKIWQDVLNLNRVGLYDNFFDLGGHSLLATQVVARIRDHFKIEVQLRLLFETRCIFELAEWIDDRLPQPIDAASGVEGHAKKRRLALDQLRVKRNSDSDRSHRT